MKFSGGEERGELGMGKGWYHSYPTAAAGQWATMMFICITRWLNLGVVAADVLENLFHAILETGLLIDCVNSGRLRH